MASSVSSERAFSQAGITISDRRARLKPDVVEALQFVKCLLKRDLIFRAPAPSSALEEEIVRESHASKMALDEEDSVQGKGDHPWDLALLDENDQDLYE